MKVSYAQAALTTGLTGGALRTGIEFRLTRRFYEENPSKSRDDTKADGLMLGAFLLAVIVLWMFDIIVNEVLPTIDLSLTMNAVMATVLLVGYASGVFLTAFLGLTSLKLFIEVSESLRLYVVKHRDDEVEL